MPGVGASIGCRVSRSRTVSCNCSGPIFRSFAGRPASRLPPSIPFLPANAALPRPIFSAFTTWSVTSSPSSRTAITTRMWERQQTVPHGSAANAGHALCEAAPLPAMDWNFAPPRDIRTGPLIDIPTWAFASPAPLITSTFLVFAYLPSRRATLLGYAHEKRRRKKEARTGCRVW